jgi:uncharacterized protein YbgA (DUF1722 family)/uncharacterized protein YbbK (DUF523 family)
MGKFIEFHPVCPETELGLGTPREPMRLAGNPSAPRLVTNITGIDLTDGMNEWAARRVLELESLDLWGFIFKNRSPSSGMERVKIFDDNGVPTKKGVGLFARAFMEHFPLVPVEENLRLQNPLLRENFIERVFALKRWRDFLVNPTRAGLVDFHSSHKLQIMSHSPKHYTEMGLCTANLTVEPLPSITKRYQALLMTALRLKATRKKHYNVMLHILGYFKEDLDADEKTEVIEVLEHYKNGYLPLSAPVTLLNHFARKFDQSYLKMQSYLKPHPLELRLRCHA